MTAHDEINSKTEKKEKELEEIQSNLQKEKRKWMFDKYFQYCIYFFIGFAIAVGIELLSNTSDTSIAFGNADISEMRNLLIALLFIAWLLESFLEILLKTFKLDELEKLNRLEEEKAKKSSEVAKFTAIVGFIIGLIIAWSGVHTLGVFFSFENVANPDLGTISNSVVVPNSVADSEGMVVPNSKDNPDSEDNSSNEDNSNSEDNPDKDDNPNGEVVVPDSKDKSFQEKLFAFADAILTAGVLAGGSKGIHEFINASKEFMGAIKKKAA